MKAPRLSTLTSLVAFSLVSLASQVGATVTFIETFETPDAGGSFIALPTGIYAFDNSGWQINNDDLIPSEVGVFLNDGAVGFPTSSQVLGFGAENVNPTTDNEAIIVLDGFVGLNTPDISFDYLQAGGSGQGIAVFVTDPNNSDFVLYSSGNLFGNGTIATTMFDSAPVGDEIEVTIRQVGNSVNSDSAIDNIVITAIPEPSSVLLLGLGGLALATRRRRA